VNRRRCDPEAAGDLDRPKPMPPPQFDDWRLSRSDVLFGLECGRLDRSAIPAGPSALNRAAHLRAVTVETMNIFAASDGFQPSSTINLASRSRAFGVKAALAWDTKASWQ
jgi:hypothetical protein